jgi:hypothetical protein
MTIVESVVVSILRERGEEAGAAEMEKQYQRFMSLTKLGRRGVELRPVERGRGVRRRTTPRRPRKFFVEHWSGPGAWDVMGRRGRATVTALVPKLRLEIPMTRSDAATLAWLSRVATADNDPAR